MDAQDIDVETRSPARRSRLRGAADGLIVWAHREAQRRDLVPAEFGQGSPVDETDASALLHEWTHQARLWADYNPEEMLALKAGAVGLGAALLVLVIAIGAIR
jgi:hypothetical protein